MRWFLLALLSASLLSSGAGLRAHAQQTASVAVDPAGQTVPLQSGPFEVRITVDDVTVAQGLGGYTLVMTYDPDVVHARVVADSGFLASTENTVLCPASATDNDEGRLAHLCLTIPVLEEPGPQTSEPQVLARVTFEPFGEGTTTLDISETTLIDPQGNALEASTSNGEVIVGSGAAPATDAPEDGGNAAQRGGGDGGGNAGLYVGVIAGVVVAVAVLAAGAWLVVRRRSAGA